MVSLVNYTLVPVESVTFCPGFGKKKKHSSFAIVKGLNRELRCDVTLPWLQNFWMTTMGSLSNDDGDGNENGKKAIGFY